MRHYCAIPKTFAILPKPVSIQWFPSGARDSSKWSIPWHHSTNGLPQITTRKRSPNANSSATIGAGSTFTARFKSINHTYRDVIEIEILTDSEMSKVNT